MFKVAMPLLRVSSSIAAENFYCGQLGFRKHYAHRACEPDPDPCFMGLSRDDV